MIQVARKPAMVPVKCFGEVKAKPKKMLVAAAGGSNPPPGGDGDCFKKPMSPEFLARIYEAIGDSNKIRLENNFKNNYYKKAV